MRIDRLTLLLLALLAGSALWLAGPFAVSADTADDAHSLFTPTFAPPPPVEDSILKWLWYGRLANYTDVYTQPSTAADWIRNVGKGYIFASMVSRHQRDDGEWFQINHNEFVHEDNVTLARPSLFHGFRINRQPERAIGWVVRDMTRPSAEPDGPPSFDFERLPRYTFFEIYDAALGEHDYVWYNIGGGRWVHQFNVSMVDVNPRPEGVPEDGWWIEIDLYEQTLAAYEGDRMVYATLISSGLNKWRTREGLFEVWSRFERSKMSGAEGQYDYYFVEDVPHILYFDNDIGLHGAYWHDRFGYKHSHGCVNMAPLDSEWVFYWSEKREEPLWVWVHTSDPVELLEAHQAPKSAEPSRVRLGPDSGLH
jgi:hypothetical protein